MRGRKKRVVVPDDIGEAREVTARAAKMQREAEAQDGAIVRLTNYLNERRANNHFGESIQITYTRRGSGC